MPREKQAARVMRWRGDWYLFFTDHSTGKQHRRRCQSLGATNAEQRSELVRQYRARERQQRAETVLRGGAISGNTLLRDEVEDYLRRCRERAKTREANPDVRAGLSAAALDLIEDKIGHFLAWLKESRQADLATKDLTASILEQYTDKLIRETAPYAKGPTKKRSAATVNIYKRNLKACLRWIDSRRPRRFADFTPLLRPLAPTGGKSKPPTAFAPDELGAFLAEALKREDPDRVVLVTPRDGSRKKEAYEQRMASAAQTPVSRLFLLLALTGCRLGEALRMKWEDVDLKRGLIRIESTKTGYPRTVPMLNAPEGEIAPKFVSLMNRWWEEDEDRRFVLPHGELALPTFPKGAWYKTDEASNGLLLGPQKLRQNFTSYAASLGIPPAVAALWQGHSADVAQRHYRAQVLERNPDAESFEDAMGLSEVIDRLLNVSDRPRPRKG